MGCSLLPPNRKSTGIRTIRTTPTLRGAIPSSRTETHTPNPLLPLDLHYSIRNVHPFDSSAVSVLCKFFQAAQSGGVRVVLSAADARFRNAVKRSLPASTHCALLMETNEDRALERCEDIAITAGMANSDGADGWRSSLLERSAEDLDQYLERQVAFEKLVEDIDPWLSIRQYAAEEVIAGSGGPQDGLRLLLSGRVSAFDQEGARLYQLGPGAPLCPAGMDRSSEFVLFADEACRVVELAPRRAILAGGARARTHSSLLSVSHRFPRVTAHPIFLVPTIRGLTCFIGSPGYVCCVAVCGIGST